MIWAVREGNVTDFLIPKGHERKIQFDWTRRSETPAALDNEELRLSMVATW